MRSSGTIVLGGVRYQDYTLLRDLRGNDHVRMTYHNGLLELMPRRARYERHAARFFKVVSVVCEEMGIPFEAAGVTEFPKSGASARKGHGKEPDESFYFANAARILKIHNQVNLDLDPPPDVWVEIDGRAHPRGNLALYAALGVPEVWRYRVSSKRLWFGKLNGARSKYEPIMHSLSLPMLTPALLLEAFTLGRGVSPLAWSNRLRAWVRTSLKSREQR